MGILSAFKSSSTILVLLAAIAMPQFKNLIS